MPTRTTEYVLRALEAEGLDHVFMVPGGLIDPFLAAFAEVPGVTPIVAAHEGGAAFMADGYARARNGLGACLAIGGPGITNMATAVASARADEVPLLVVSGQVPTAWEGRGGFQDSSPASLNDIAMLAPASRPSLSAESVHLVHHHLRACLTGALAGGQGPAHLSLPLDVQRDEVLHDWQPLHSSGVHPRVCDEQALGEFWRMLCPKDGGHAPTRIAMLAGYGVVKSRAWEPLTRFAERFDIPVATTLKSKGVFPEDHPLSLGIFGYAGHRPAIDALLSGEVEVLLVLGSGLSQRDTMFWNKRMRPIDALVHVDVNPEVLGRTFDDEVSIAGDCGAVLERLLQMADAGANGLEKGRQARRQWLDSVLSAGPRVYDGENLTSDASPMHPARVIAELRKVFPRDGAMLMDSGAHRAFCTHYWESYAPLTFFSAANIGPMGWGIPATVGVQAALPNRRVALVTGDGCMLMHGIEMQTAARYDMPIIYVVMNNASLANVWLRAHTQGPVPARLTELPRHDWAGFARSLGLEGINVERPEDLAPAFDKALSCGRAVCLDVACDKAFTTPVTPYAQAKMEWVDME